MRERFEQIVHENIQHDGIDNVMKYLASRDFYTAPASTRFHNAFDGGLLLHSLNVYDCLVKINDNFNLGLKPESMAICGLFHDVCKMDTCKKGKRNVKNEQGQWESDDTFERDEEMPLGHGEKSVFLLNNSFIRLTLNEMYAIRWHMGGFDSAVKGGEQSISKAYEKCPLAVALHLADMDSTYLVEEQN